VEKDNKKIILADLTKGLLVMKNIDLDQEEFYTENIRDLIESADLEEYNQLLIRVLKKHVTSFVCTTKILTQWRKKIKNWIKSIDKPETRGGVVISHEILDFFKQKLFNILDQLPFRCFPTLRTHVLDILQTFPVEYQKEVNSKTCSKHWWFNFLQKNDDVKEKWESIPLERSLNKNKRLRKGSHSEFDSCNSTTGNSNSPAASPVADETFDICSPSLFMEMEEEKVVAEIPQIPEICKFEAFDEMKILNSPSRFLFEEEDDSVKPNMGLLFFDSRDFLENESKDLWW